MSQAIEALAWLDWWGLSFACSVACCERLEALLTARRRPSLGSLAVTAAVLVAVLALVPV